MSSLSNFSSSSSVVDSCFVSSANNNNNSSSPIELETLSNCTSEMEDGAGADSESSKNESVASSAASCTISSIDRELFPVFSLTDLAFSFVDEFEVAEEIAAIVAAAALMAAVISAVLVLEADTVGAEGRETGVEGGGTGAGAGAGAAVFAKDFPVALGLALGVEDGVDTGLESCFVVDARLCGVGAAGATDDVFEGVLARRVGVADVLLGVADLPVAGGTETVPGGASFRVLEEALRSRD
mmetsp:Transcript_40728/g.41586  ORF Transcript_40728/g.41586 Transcript_40728/m.41586 type:complete len:241 (+) Transcript_40728:270-992(+)